jgi:hypothetical protein
MKIFAPLLLTLLAAPATVVPVTPAVAQTAADCEAQIAALGNAAGGVAISGKNAEKDRAGLAGKLSDASTELAQGKNVDAAKKLADFKIKIQQLADAQRISSTDAATLLAQADTAIACVNGLG